MSDRAKDGEVLADRVAELEAEHARLGAEVEAARHELDERTRSRDERIRDGARRGKRGPRIMGVVVVLLIVFGVLLAIRVRLVAPERLEGQVVERIGPAPALVGDACVLSVEPAYLPYNAWIQLDCGARRLYGFESYGHLQCDTAAQHVTRCEDSGPIALDGDPHLVVDRAAGRVQLDDGSRWRLRIALPRSPRVAVDRE